MAKVLIVDYGLGNLFSIQNACRKCGLESFLCSERASLESAEGVILPGVGAFGDAMSNLSRLGLVGPLRDYAESGRPLMGVCLGFQLLFRESWEFGRHQGLGLLDGEVVPLDQATERKMRVPQVGWNTLEARGDWKSSYLRQVSPGSWFYFVHSFRVEPSDSSVVLSTTRYVNLNFCSSVQRKNVFGCQFHPERSGRVGLAIYEEFARTLTEREPRV